MGLKGFQRCEGSVFRPWEASRARCLWDSPRLPRTCTPGVGIRVRDNHELGIRFQTQVSMPKRFADRPDTFRAKEAPICEGL